MERLQSTDIGKSPFLLLSKMKNLNLVNNGIVYQSGVVSWPCTEFPSFIVQLKDTQNNPNINNRIPDYETNPTW